VLATVTARENEEGPDVSVVVLGDLDPVVGALASGGIVAAGIDIPIGLTASGPRSCDLEARRLLGPRRSSVFPAPAREVLRAWSY
jgi:predicted RNase H-like nuclease